MFRPVHDVTVGDLLARVATDCPRSEAFAFPAIGARRSFAEVEQESRLLARGLLRLGVRKGDRVAVWAPNLPEWIELQFALAKLGAVLVTVNTSHRRQEIEHLLAHCAARVLAVADGAKGNDFHQTVCELVPEVLASSPPSLRSKRFPELETVVTLGEKRLPGAVDYRDVLALSSSVPDDELRRAERNQDPEDFANMQYTSGTTGHARGVMLSHRNIVENAFTAASRFELKATDRLCCAVPFFHCFGCVLGVLAPFSHAAPTVPCIQFSGESALSLVEEERCTWIYGVPTMYLAELETPGFDRYDLTSLRGGVIAGAPCPPELVTRVIREMHCPELAIGYGLTEASPAVTFSDVREPAEERARTAGYPMPGVEVAIQELATRRTLPSLIEGEICVRGPFVMKGYFRDDEATRRAIDERGFLHTGDLGSIDGRGRLIVTGRAKELIIRAGENISPREIEGFLRTHPAVADVAVFGVRCRHHGEDLGAAVRLRAGVGASPGDLQAFCRGQLADHKVPVLVVVVPEFPMTGSGKIQKFKLGEAAMSVTAGDCATLRFSG